MDKPKKRQQLCDSMQHEFHSKASQNVMDGLSKTFLSTFCGQAAEEEYVLLDFLPSSIRKHSAHYVLNLLVSLQAYNRIAKILSAAEGLNFIRTRTLKHHQEMELIFKDLSKLTVYIQTTLRMGGTNYVDDQQVIKNARIENGFRVPSLPHAYELQLIQSISHKTDFPEAYKDYFSALSFNERTLIFSYVVPKYKFVINMLSDLYHYRTKNAKRVFKALGKKKGLMKITDWNAAWYFFTGWLHALLFGRWNYYYQADTAHPRTLSLAEFLMRRAYVKVG